MISARRACRGFIDIGDYDKAPLSQSPDSSFADAGGAAVT